MDEMEGMIQGQGRLRNIQSFEDESSRRYEISRDPLLIDTLQSGRHRNRPSSPTTNRKTQTSRDTLQSSRHSTSYDPRDNNRITQTSRDALQSARLSTSYDRRDNNRITQTSRDVLQSTRFSTSYDPRDNNRNTEGRQNQERQTVNASTRGAGGNNFEGRILKFFARRKKNDVCYI
jgi:hypothetical protein